MGIGDTNTDGAQLPDSENGNDAALRLPSWLGGKRWAEFCRSALDLVLPPLCLGCQTRLCDHDSLCPECWRGIDFIRPPLCDRLGIPMPYDIGSPMISAAAAADPPIFDRARGVARYDGLMREMIHEFKFRDSHNARRLFGRWMSQADRALVSAADVIVPVPLARLRLFTRRFNQAQVLAVEVARAANKPLLSLTLKRTRSTSRQVGLSRQQRIHNLRGAFVVTPEAVAHVAGRSVLLIDDVMTTGATASAAARALKAAGAVRVDVLVLAIVTDPS